MIKYFLNIMLSVLILTVLCGCKTSADKPNIILFIADDLGYGEVGCYGQEKIKTPHIDQLAAEGMKFTQFYSGSPVCAPSRCVLLTGKHSGHAYIRDNYAVHPEGQLAIPKDEVTVAELLKSRGYITAAIGKWGLGSPGSVGDPLNQGFDFFFGYNCQRHAHNYYPRYLWKNDKKIILEGNDRGLTGKQYAADLMEKEALQFIRENNSNPFFLYYPTPVPHLALQVPEESLEPYVGLWEDPAYDGKNAYLPHPHPRAAYAAMVTRMDRTLGRMLKLLKELRIEKNTLVIFSSDNGATYLGGYDRAFFKGNGPLRSHKGYLYEGGIRVPMIVRWPGKITPGTVSDQIGAFQDILPTLLDITGGTEIIPQNIDGISLKPTFTGDNDIVGRDFLYFEFPAYGGQQAVRLGDWKGIRTGLKEKESDSSIHLYNLKTDLGESKNVAQENPEIIDRIKKIMQDSHQESKAFPFPELELREW
jgi:arylsulfatase